MPILIIMMLVLAACSTTKRLGPHETLYTGVKKFDVSGTGGEKLPSGLVSELKSAINVKPNNPMPFLSPYVRTPFPIGLWVWNNWSDSCKGIKKWLYDRLAKEPVLIEDVRPDLRVEMMKSILDNNGYFGSKVNYELIYSKRNNKKARISYDVDASAPYLIDSVIYIGSDKDGIGGFIDSVARKLDYLQPGERFCVDSLEDVRINITNRLRNKGYYYFRPEYIEFLADSTITPHRIALKLTIGDNVPSLALRKFRTDRIVTIVERQSNKNPGTPDTIATNRGDVIVMRPARLREDLIPSCITFRKGSIFSVRDMDNTQTRLSRTGLFQSIQIQPVPADTSANNPLMDVYITCKFDRPMEASVEVNATSKSNSYIGPGLVFGLQHHNLFGGAEKLTLQLNANYEWQTGSERSSVFNSYEFGLQTSLAFPRLLAPNFIKRTRREINWTTFSLGASVLNRPHYFKMAQMNLGITYDWRMSRHVQNSYTPFKLTYTKLLNTTEVFDSIMRENPAIAQSFQSQFIPQMSYTYTYDRFFERARNNGITFTATVTEAGNIFSGLWALCGVHGEKKLFRTPFSQFIKGQAQVIYQRRLIPKTEHWLVTRFLIGAEHAYGNSKEVPYSEQFYIGGANSIRAFTVRSIGPGSYRAPRNAVNGYFDQTGTFKLELNAEYRFPLVSILHGALFVDAGNVWILKKDSLRPGGELRASTFLRDIALGTGVGLRVDVGMIVIRGDLGYGLHAPYNTGHSGYFNIPFHKAFAFHLALGYPF
ncbi:MAG: BamA/TamA family outer membrane protein [Prevotella sp.]|nr:BamA/TamA family outer membrane protein [Bacteroides sp.]MCM1437413.1 BamA/TamA family outer membrane protein [Prevotella sp.]